MKEFDPYRVHLGWGGPTQYDFAPHLLRETLGGACVRVQSYGNSHAVSYFDVDVMPDQVETVTAMVAAEIEAAKEHGTEGSNAQQHLARFAFLASEQRRRDVVTLIYHDRVLDEQQQAEWDEIRRQKAERKAAIAADPWVETKDLLSDLCEQSKEIEDRIRDLFDDLEAPDNWRQIAGDYMAIRDLDPDNDKRS